MFLLPQHIVLSPALYGTRMLTLEACHKGGLGGFTELGRIRQDASCFGEVIHPLEDKEPRPRSAQIRYRVEQSEVCPPDDGVGNLRIERRCAHEHHRAKISPSLQY
jgi:hypothetical protein